MQNSFNQSNNITRFIKLFGLTNRYIIQFRINDYRKMISPFLLSLVTRVESRGSIDTIKWLKDLRVCMYAYLAQQPVELRHLSVLADGFPKIFREFHTFVKDGDQSAIRFLLTVLQISRFLDGQKAPDYTPITDKETWSPGIFQHLDSKFPKIMDQVGLAGTEIPLWEVPHFSSKGSPSGPAMYSLKNDLTNLTPQIISDIEEVAGETLRKYIEDLRANPEIITIAKEPRPERKNRLRAHALVNDTEAKTRVIAMADYWTQTSLLPLHNKLLHLLSRFGESDLTFGQDIQPFGDPTQPYYSYDLTSATDRLPRFLYVTCLRHLFGDKYSKSWERLMTDEGYHGPDGRIRKYATGQPMGLYSSWPLLAVVHHLIVLTAAHDIGIRRFRDYRLLGDDIVIRHQGVATRYARILEDLGVKISPEKTLVSSDTFEFAKRIFHKGIEVTAFPLHGISSATQTGWQDLYSVMETASKRNFGGLHQLLSTQLVERYYTILGKAYRIGKTSLRWCRMFYMLTSGDFKSKVVRHELEKFFPRLGCTTDVTELGLNLERRYSEELSAEMQRCLEKTCEVILTTFGITEQETQEISDAWYHDRQIDLMEPIKWVSLDQMSRMDNAYLNIMSDTKGITTEREWITVFRKTDYRIIDPAVLDRSRKAERLFRLRASCGIKAFLHEAKDTIKLP
jgi:hypothetical protein